VTTASAATGVAAGTRDQIVHTEINVSSHDCNFCHTQVGAAAAAPVRGKEWAQALFHANVRAVVVNGTTGRCSNCHMNVKPGPSFTSDHSAFTATSSQDCSSCHTFPGTGSPTSPNWLGAGAPDVIAVGGFTIPAPPASSPTVQPGIAGLPHPAGNTCTACHTSSAGGRPAIGYDHASSLASSSCNACHEAGTNLVATTWNGATTESAGAGDSRPFTLTSVNVQIGGSAPIHYYPVDCSFCHVIPSGNGTLTSGSAYTSAWHFRHPNKNQACSTTCQKCHSNGRCSGN